MQTLDVPTPDALKIIGVPHRAWRDAVDKGFYMASPPSIHGKRCWQLDDMTCKAWYRALCKSGMHRPMAGGLSGLLKEAIAANPHVENFNVYAWEDGDQGRIAIGTEPPSQAPRAQIILVMPLAQWRRNVRAAVDAFYAKRAASKVKAKK